MWQQKIMMIQEGGDWKVEAKQNGALPEKAGENIPRNNRRRDEDIDVKWNEHQSMQGRG